MLPDKQYADGYRGRIHQGDRLKYALTLVLTAFTPVAHYTSRHAGHPVLFAVRVPAVEDHLHWRRQSHPLELPAGLAPQVLPGRAAALDPVLRHPGVTAGEHR